LHENGFVEHSLNPDSILSEIEATLKRLKTDYIDLYQIHFPDGKTAWDKVFSVMQKLQKEKMIRYFGVSNFSVELLKETKGAGYVSVQNRFNIFQKDEGLQVLKYCQDENLGFIAYSPLCQGIFSKSIDENFRPSKRDVRHLNPIFTNEVFFNEAISEKNKMKNPLKEALRFVIDTPALTGCLVTMTRAEHVKENVSLIQM
jgi:aryl-alcohol dehydrogenase-like predicted oxidoreductase